MVGATFMAPVSPSTHLSRRPRGRGHFLLLSREAWKWPAACRHLLGWQPDHLQILRMLHCKSILDFLLTIWWQRQMPLQNLQLAAFSRLGLNTLHLDLNTLMLRDWEMIAHNDSSGMSSIIMHSDAIRVGDAAQIALQKIAFLGRMLGQFALDFDAIIKPKENLKLLACCRRLDRRGG